jgi:hypothetical protein
MGVTSPDLVGRAFAASRTLKRLTVKLDFDDEITLDSYEVLALQALASVTSLNELHLCFLDDVDEILLDAISRLLRLTSSIQHLILGNEHSDGAYFTADELSILLSGLNQNRSITKLTLHRFQLANDARQPLIDFVRSNTSAIQELSMVSASRTFGHGNDSLGISMGMALVGSSLSSLRFDDIQFSDFCPILRQNAPLIQIQQLYMGECYLPKLECTALADCLPLLKHLRELHIPQLFCCDAGTSVPLILDALSRNGSLHKFVIISAKTCSLIRPFDDKEARLASAYCQRNQAVPYLLARLMPTDEMDADAVHLYGASLFPSLCASMRPVSVMYPNAILIGLLSCSRFIGDECRHL